MKSDRIRSFSDPYSVRLQGNTEQKNSEYGHLSRSQEPSIPRLLQLEMKTETMQLATKIQSWTKHL